MVGRRNPSPDWRIQMDGAVLSQSSQHPDTHVRELEHYLRRLRAMARALLATRALALLGACGIAALLLGGAIDFLLRSPPAVRVIGLAAAVVVGVWATFRHVWPALRFRPSLTELALRLERHDPGGDAGLRGWLASAIELSDEQAHQSESPALRSAAIAEALRRWKAAAYGHVLRTGPAAQAVLVLSAALVCLALLVATEPALARIGAKRMLFPWLGTEWPKRQLVVDVTPLDIHAIDEALPMRAAVVRTNRSLGNTPVRVEYRGRTSRGDGPWRSAALTGQMRHSSLQDLGLHSRGQGELYERLIDPAEVLATVAQGVDEGYIEYRFETEDDQTVSRTVRVVRPPQVVGAVVTIDPPEYARGDAQRVGLAAEAGRDLGKGNDERALLSGVVAGSRMSLTIRSSKPIGTDAKLPQPAWMLALADGASDLSIRQEGAQFVIDAVLERSVRLPVELIDEFGFRSRDEAVYSFDVRPDDPPEPVVSVPESDEQLIPTAFVPVEGQARDDLGVVHAALEYQLARPPEDSEGAPPEATEPWAALQSWSGAATAEMTVQAQVDLAALGVRAGDEVWISTVATDTYAAAGLGREPVRSGVRRLRVISESDLIEQIRAELGGLRQTAMRLDEQQAQLRDRLAEDGATRGLSAQQGELTDRIASQRATLDRLERRLARNSLDDPALSGLLNDANAAIGAAAESSSRASQEIAEQSNADEQEPERAAQEQQRVRDELANLINLLDRGEDGWVARRSVERLLEEQREIMEQTRRAGERMIGRDADQLTPQERSELDMIAERQREAAQRAGEAIDELSERSQQLSQADPSQSAAMAEAARQGRQQQVAQQLDQAAQDVQQNRTSSAQSGQQQAIDALEQMLEELDNAERNRNAALLRQLASLIQSLETLIRVQEAQIEQLALAQVRNEATGLDAGMIRLHDNTLAVLADAQQPDLAPVRTPLEDASKAQTEAITALRAQPADLEAASRSEQTSLLKMREALAEAQKLEEEAQQQEQERIRRELRQAYREQLEQEVVVRDEARQFEGRQLSRRDRASARGLGQRQQTIHDALEDLVKSTEGLSDAAVFDFAHRRLAHLTDAAANRLQLGEVDERATRSIDEAVSLLRSLVEALAPSQGQNEFDAGAAGGGGSGSGGSGSGQQDGLLPPIAELKLLRSMQAMVAQETRAVDESGAPASDLVNELADLQNELAEQARSLMERMQQQNQPTPEGHQ